MLKFFKKMGIEQNGLAERKKMGIEQNGLAGLDYYETFSPVVKPTVL